MRVVYFGSGSVYSARILDALASTNVVASVILPEIQASGLKGLIRRAAIWRLSREMRHVIARHKLRAIRYRADGLIPLIGSIDPDLIVVASFPHILPPTLLALPRHGCLNVHPSLLPRHRGADPVFWTYFADDCDTGVTIHWMSEEVDAGDIVAQGRIPLERGLPASALNARLAALGGELLAQAIADLTAGRDARTPQNERLATHEPLPSQKTFTIDYATWPAERVWHFLRGVGDRVGLGDPAGYVVQSHGSSPGTISESRLYCVDGWVDFRRRPLRRRITAVLFRTLFR